MSSAQSPLTVSAADVWEHTLAQIMLRVTRQNYETWLRNTAGVRFEGTTLVVSAANDLACDWLSTRMRSVIAHALTAAGGHGLKARFEPVQTDPASHPLQPSMLPDAARPLNPRFTFGTFLAADFNRLPLTAAQEVAASEECRYSPLFIAGGSGSGKTHLLHAMGHAATASKAVCVLVNADQFLSEYSSAAQQQTIPSFRARYRSADLLLIDDVHLLAGKKASINEFCMTVSCLHDQGRRVAVAGDRSALSLEGSRFKGLLHWGLVAHLDQPSTEDRIRFVAAKALQHDVLLPDEVQHYLALRVKSSVRDLEGAVNRVTALARISRQPITLDFVAQALQQPAHTMSEEEPVSIMPSALLDAVCKHLGVCEDEIRGPKRERSLTYARHLAMYLLRQHAGLSYAAIASLLGKKDHSTVVHACTQIHKELDVSPNLRADIDSVMSAIHRQNPAA